MRNRIRRRVLFAYALSVGEGCIFMPTQITSKFNRNLLEESKIRKIKIWSAKGWRIALTNRTILVTGFAQALAKPWVFTDSNLHEKYLRIWSIFVFLNRPRITVYYPFQVVKYSERVHTNHSERPRLLRYRPYSSRRLHFWAGVFGTEF